MQLESIKADTLIIHGEMDSEKQSTSLSTGGIYKIDFGIYEAR